MGERYYIDERVGCIAVRDSLVKTDDSHLDSQTEGVAGFWMGQWRQDECPTCHQKCGGHWEIGEGIKAEATRLCEKLNAEDRLNGRPARMIDLPDDADKAP